MKTIKELQAEFTFRKLQGTLPFRISTPPSRTGQWSAGIDLIQKPEFEEEFQERVEKMRAEGFLQVDRSLAMCTKVPVTLKEFIALHGYMPAWKPWE